MVLHTLNGEILSGGLIDDETATVILPCVAAEESLILLSLSADFQIGATREGIVGYVERLRRLEALPVVVAPGGVLHHLQFLEVRATLKSAFANEEVKVEQCIVIVSVGILEIHRLKLTAIAEGMRSDESQMGMITPVTHQVVVNLHAIAVIVALLISRDSRNLRSLATAVLDNHIGITVSAFKRPAFSYAILVANIIMVVATREVAISDTPVSAFGFRFRDYCSDNANRRSVSEIFQLVHTVTCPRIADKTSVVIHPVVEGHTARCGETYPATILIVILAINGHLGFALELIGTTFCDIDITNHKHALLDFSEMIGRIAVGESQIAVFFHSGEGGAATNGFEVGPSLRIEESVGNHHWNVRPSHEASTVSSIHELGEFATERAFLNEQRVGTFVDTSHQSSKRCVATLHRMNRHLRVTVIETCRATSFDTGNYTSRILTIGMQRANCVQVTDGSTAHPKERSHSISDRCTFMTAVHGERVVVTIEGSVERVRLSSYRHAFGVDVVSQAEDFSAIRCAILHIDSQFHPLRIGLYEIGIGFGSATNKVAGAHDGGTDDHILCTHRQMIYGSTGL